MQAQACFQHRSAKFTSTQNTVGDGGGVVLKKMLKVRATFFPIEKVYLLKWCLLMLRFSTLSEAQRALQSQSFQKCRHSHTDGSSTV